MLWVHAALLETALARQRRSYSAGQRFDRGVPTPGVVKALDVIEDGHAGLVTVLKTLRSMSSHSKVAKKLSAMALSKQSPTDPIERLYSGSPTSLGEVIARVLASLIRVVNHDTIRTLAGDGHLEGSGDELGVLVRRHRPARRPAG